MMPVFESGLKSWKHYRKKKSKKLSDNTGSFLAYLTEIAENKLKNCRNTGKIIVSHVDYAQKGLIEIKCHAMIQKMELKMG